MPLSAIDAPQTDPTSIFEFFRGNYATEILCAAISEFGLFEKLAIQPMAEAELRRAIGLEERPAEVLFTALRAMRLLERDAQGQVQLTPLSREHLLAGAPFDVSDYVSLAGGSPGVQELVKSPSHQSPGRRR